MKDEVHDVVVEVGQRHDEHVVSGEPDKPNVRLSPVVLANAYTAQQLISVVSKLIRHE